MCRDRTALESPLPTQTPATRKPAARNRREMDLRSRRVIVHNKHGGSWKEQSLTHESWLLVISSWLPLIHLWKAEVERRAAVCIVCGPEFSSMRGNDATADRKTKPHSVRFRGEERL